MSEEKEQMIKTLRQKALQDTEKVAQAQRFALFSQPPPLAVGDDSLFQKKKFKKNENGKIETQPRNIQVSCPKKGKIKSSYFSLLGFTTIGDKYIDQDRIIKQDELNKKKLIKQDQVFKPASSYKSVIKSEYEHIPETIYKTKNYKDNDGRVTVAPKNILTSVTVKNIFKQPQYMADPYDRARQLISKERLKHIDILKDKPAFKSKLAGGKSFTKDRQLYGFEGSIQPKTPQEIKFNIYKHDNPFKPSSPSKKGRGGLIGKIYEYMSDPIKEAKRINNEKGKDQFKPNNGGNLTRPTPTIVCHPINIRKEMRAN